MPLVYCAGAMGIDSGLGRELFAVGARGVGLGFVVVVVFVMARSVDGGGDERRVIGMSNSCPTTRPPCEGVTRSLSSLAMPRRRQYQQRTASATLAKGNVPPPVHDQKQRSPSSPGGLDVASDVGYATMHLRRRRERPLSVDNVCWPRRRRRRCRRQVELYGPVWEFFVQVIPNSRKVRAASGSARLRSRLKITAQS